MLIQNQKSARVGKTSGHFSRGDRPRSFCLKDFVKEGAVVIDVGMNRDANGKLIGDVKFDEVEPIASYITPVPRGVGPMTITMLMAQTIEAAKETMKN